MNRQSANFVNYQDRAAQFSVGDTVAPFGMLENWSGRVTAVWPAIGMVDVETPIGNKRYPVEDLQKFVDGNAVPPLTNSAPSTEMVSVPGGPQPKAAADRVALAFSKKALYWASRDRKYRVTREESVKGMVTCPRCPEHPSLKRATFRRRDGCSERLLGCPTCMFLIHDEDILNLEPLAQVEGV